MFHVLPEGHYLERTQRIVAGINVIRDPLTIRLATAISLIVFQMIWINGSYLSTSTLLMWCETIQAVHQAGGDLVCNTATALNGRLLVR